MANEIGRYVPPPALPVVPVQPPPAPETPPDGETGASSARLALVTSGAAASAPAAQVSAPVFEARSADIGATPVLSADPSVETFADDYLNASRDVPPETGRSDNVSALFSRNNAGRTSGAL